MANAMIHCVYIDACPNSVCEALVAGCPVICTNMGGQVELVSRIDPDAIVHCDSWDFRKRNRRKQPPVDTRAVAEQIVRHAADKKPFDASFLHIDNIAKQYLEFFERVLND